MEGVKTPAHRPALEEAWSLVRVPWACNLFETPKGAIKETLAYTGLRLKEGHFQKSMSHFCNESLV